MLFKISCFTYSNLRKKNKIENNFLSNHQQIKISEIVSSHSFDLFFLHSTENCLLKYSIINMVIIELEVKSSKSVWYLIFLLCKTVNCNGFLYLQNKLRLFKMKHVKIQTWLSKWPACSSTHSCHSRFLRNPQTIEH